MALIRCNKPGDAAPSKYAVVTTQVNTGSVQVVYDNGSGQDIDVNTQGTGSTASDLVSITIAASQFTVTFKVDCEVYGSYGTTSVTGHKSAGNTVTFSYGQIFALYAYI